MKTVGVLALQGDVREHGRALEGAGARVVHVRRASDLVALDGLVIPGGESTTMWKLATVFELFQPLQAAIKSGLPTYGSCAGMIMLANEVVDGVKGQQTLGGMDVVVRRNAFGRQVDSFETDLVIPALGQTPMRLVFIRAPWVEKVGPEVEVLAQVPSNGASPRIVAVRQGVLLATSFHPEVTQDLRFHRYFVDQVC